MDEIGKLLFNALASKKAIWLPVLGTFSTQYVPAKDNGDGSVTPPRNEVLFSTGRGADAADITGMMRQEPGGETPAVRYERWLVKATERGPAVIDGIGVVNNGVFTPYESLLNALNPIPAAEGVKKPAAKKGLSKVEKRWIAFIAICVLILASGWTWWHMTDGEPFGHRQWNARNPAVTDNIDHTPVHNKAVKEIIEEEELPEHTDVTGEQEVHFVVSEPAQERGQAVAGTPAPGFYVVGNVFSVPGNADEYIAKMKKKYPDLDYGKHPYQGTKTLVTLYGPADRTRASREQRRIEDRIYQYDLWIYEVK